MMRCSRLGNTFRAKNREKKGQLRRKKTSSTNKRKLNWKTREKGKLYSRKEGKKGNKRERNRVLGDAVRPHVSPLRPAHGVGMWFISSKRPLKHCPGDRDSQRR